MKKSIRKGTPIPKKTILVLGASGYIGRHLIPRLIEKGHAVRGLTRDKRQGEGLKRQGAEIYEGDLLQLSSLSPAFDGVESVYFLAHSLEGGKSRLMIDDCRQAKNAVWMADHFGVKRIIYLGALGRQGRKLSLHLNSRHRVGDILRGGKAAVTEFRAAIVIGGGGASFELIYYLVKHIPVIVCPLWILIGTQPVALDDAVRYLVEALEKSESEGRILDICGPDIVTYCDMMEAVARALNVKRRMIFVPILTPRLSSFWINLVTPVPIEMTRLLIEGLRYRTVCENKDVLRIFDFEPMGLEQAIRIALEQQKELEYSGEIRDRKWGN
jgi:uncharacterized protein YbjT (DUF2867 family)